MRRRDDDGGYDRAYANFLQAQEENEQNRIDWIKENPRYKTRKEYDDAFSKLDEKFVANSMEAQMHIEGDTDALDWDPISIEREDLEKEYNELYEEYDLIYGELEKERREIEMEDLWARILYYDVHNKELADRYRKQYDDLYAEYSEKFSE